MTLAIEPTSESKPSTNSAPDVKPDAILQIAFGFAGAKVLFSAVELELFTHLAQRPMNAESIVTRLGLNIRGVRDFLDALVAMNLLNRDERGDYSNSPVADAFLDARKPGYVGGMLSMCDARLYKFWDTLTDALRTGRPQNEIKQNKDPKELFDALYNDPAKLRQFCAAMTGLSLHTGRAIAKKFPCAEYKSFVDIGTAQGALPVEIAKAHPHLAAYGFDLPVVRPVFEEYVAKNHVADRTRFIDGDFFKDAALPKADVLVMGHILHDWDMPTKRMLLAKAYDALPRGGALIVYESLIDDARRTNVAGLLMSLNMLIETPGGFDYTGADCQQWMRDTGFRDTWVEQLTGADSMVVAIR